MSTADELWHAWKRATDTVRSRVAADITAATGLSDPDYGVLSRIADGPMRQNALAESMGFHRSRLSHHLSRMRERGLVSTEPAEGGVDVTATEHGRALVQQARPVHAAAVRRYLLDPLAGLDTDDFLRALERLGPHVLQAPHLERHENVGESPEQREERDPEQQQ